MSKRAIAGNAALIVLVCIVLVGLAFFGGFQFGKEGANGSADGNENHKTNATDDLPSDRFSIVVEQDSILVDGKPVSAEAAVRLAKEDGRPVRVLWKRARTGAESELKQALQDADIIPDERTLE